MLTINQSPTDSAPTQTDYETVAMDHGPVTLTPYPHALLASSSMHSLVGMNCEMRFEGQGLLHSPFLVQTHRQR